MGAAAVAGFGGRAACMRMQASSTVTPSIRKTLSRLMAPDCTRWKVGLCSEGKLV